MNELIFVSLLVKEDELLTKEDIFEYFKKDVTIKALKRGYPENTKFRLALKEIKLNNKDYIVCFVFSEDTEVSFIQALSVEDLLMRSFLQMYEEIEKLEG